MELSEFDDTPPAGGRAVRRTIGDDDDDLEEMELVVVENCPPQEPKAAAAAHVAPPSFNEYRFGGGPSSQGASGSQGFRLGRLSDRPSGELKVRRLCRSAFRPALPDSHRSMRS